MVPQVQLEAFHDELGKLAAAAFQLRVGKSRLGKRPLSVSSLLRKEKDGTLFKYTKMAAILPFIQPPSQPGSVRPPKRKGDVPTRDETNSMKREDGRENATTVLSPSSFALANAGERYE